METELSPPYSPYTRCVPEERPAPWHDAPGLGGLATPLGVYLTDGVVSGGAGPGGLFLTGLTLGALVLLAQAAVHAVLTWGHWRVSDAGQDWLPPLLVLALVRLLPLSGTHAAEHQVIHCVERGLPLTPVDVRAMPRVHPRCGTNLGAGLSLFLMIFEGVSGAAEAHRLSPAGATILGLVVAVPPTLLLWRRVGGLLQQWFVTRPATDRQIAGGIHAAQEVLARRRWASDFVRVRPLRRLWNMGLLQVCLGCAALLGSLRLAQDHWPALGGWLGSG